MVQLNTIQGLKMVDEMRSMSQKNQLSRNWIWLLALGVIFIILGMIGLGMTVGLTLVSVLFIGVLMIIAGVLQLIDTYRCKNWQGVIWHALIGILYIIAGAVVIHDPIFASAFFTAILAWMLIAIGLVRLMMLFVLRQEKGFGWLLLSGLSALALGIMILFHWPYSGLWVLGLLIAIELIINGWSYVFISLALRPKA